MVQRTYYHPYGKPIGNYESTGENAQPYKYGGKEMESMMGLTLFDFQARRLDYSYNSFTTRDPLEEKYYSISQYAYCGNNPVNRIDPTGMDWYEDEGGNVMWKRSSLSEIEDENGVIWKSIGENYFWSDGENGMLFKQKKNKKGELYLESSQYAIEDEKIYPIYSGDNVFAKTFMHYQFGGKEPLYVSTSALDFSFVSQSDLKSTKNNTYSVNLFSINPTSKTSLALGKISLNSEGNNMYTIKKDDYDFNIEWNQGISKRNIATFGAGILHGPVIDNIPIPILINGIPLFGPSVFFGGPYQIKFKGSIYIKP